MAKSPHTGQRTPRSGVFKPNTKGKEIAVSKGNRLPPSRGKAATYKLHRRGCPWVAPASRP
jgi:hypothetical protein